MPGHKKSHKHKVNSTTALTKAVAGMAITSTPHPATPAPAPGTCSTAPAPAPAATSSSPICRTAAAPSTAATASTRASGKPSLPPQVSTSTPPATAAATDPGKSSKSPAPATTSTTATATSTSPPSTPAALPLSQPSSTPASISTAEPTIAPDPAEGAIEAAATVTRSDQDMLPDACSPAATCSPPPTSANGAAIDSATPPVPPINTLNNSAVPSICADRFSPPPIHLTSARGQPLASPLSAPTVHNTTPYTAVSVPSTNPLSKATGCNTASAEAGCTTVAPDPAYVTARTTATPTMPAPTTPPAFELASLAAWIAATATIARLQPAASATTPDSVTWEQVQATLAEHGLQNLAAILAIHQYTHSMSLNGQHAEAIARLQAALKEAITTLPVDHASTVCLSMQLASALQQAERHQAALLHYRWLLPRVMSSQYEHEPMLVLWVYRSMADCLCELGQLASAVAACKNAYETAIQHYNRSDILVVRPLIEYVTACGRARLSPDAGMVQHVTELLQQGKRDGRLDRLTLELGKSLQTCYNNTGQHELSFRLLPELVAAAKKLFGEGHPLHLQLLQSRAVNASCCNRHAQAISLFQHLLHLNKQRLGERHRDTLESVHFLAVAYQRAGRWHDSEQLLEVAWPTAKQVLSAEDDLWQQMNDVYVGALTTLGKQRRARIVALEGQL